MYIFINNFVTNRVIEGGKNMITAREYSFEKKQKQYTTEFSTINLEESKKEINKIFKKFKKITILIK